MVVDDPRDLIYAARQDYGELRAGLTGFRPLCVWGQRSSPEPGRANHSIATVVRANIEGEPMVERTRGRKWMRIRSAVMARSNWLCQECTKQGRTTPALEVDHIKPLHKGGTDAMDNLAALCVPCHEAKTAKDMGYTVKVTIGPDGWPIP